eukprot:441869-Pyramimonas_sp.AAC.1
MSRCVHAFWGRSWTQDPLRLSRCSRDSPGQQKVSLCGRSSGSAIAPPVAVAISPPCQAVRVFFGAAAKHDPVRDMAIFSASYIAQGSNIHI